MRRQQVNTSSSSSSLSKTASLAACFAVLLGAQSVQGQYTATYTPSPSNMPKTTEGDQYGTNDCGTGSSQTSNCQNFYLNSITDFCVWAPPNGGPVAANEEVQVAYCTQPGRGTRVIPEGTIQGAHFVQTRSYVQVTGTGDFTKIGISAGDDGGELDPHGADGFGNPHGGLVFHNGQQMHEWFSFMSATAFCTRACFDGDRATSLCRHTYDELGCGFNAPGNYDAGVFESCQGKDAQDIMYGYPGQPTFIQSDTSYGVPVPSAHPAPASSNCQTIGGISQTGVGYDSAPTSTSTSSTPTSTSTSSSSSSSTSSSSSSSSSSTFSTLTITSTAPTVVEQHTSGGQSANTSGATSFFSSFASSIVLLNAGLAVVAGASFML